VAQQVIDSTLFKLGFVLVIAALGIAAVVDQWSDFRSGLDRLGAAAAVEALLCVIGALLLNMLVWRLLLAASGSRVPLRAAARIFFIGQLGKYLGQVAPVLTQMEIGRAYRVPRQRTVGASMLTMLVGLATGLFATVAGLPFMAGGSTEHYWWVLLFIPVMLVFLHPRALNPAIARGLRLARKPVPDQPLTGRVIAQAIGLNLGVWFFFGLQIWVMTARLGHQGGGALMTGIGAFALAWCVGFLIIFLPAGAGARDAVLIAVLMPLVGPHAEALAIALVSRGVTTLADVILGGVAVLLGWGAGHRSTGHGTDKDELPLPTRV